MNIDHAKRVLEHQQEKLTMLISSAFPGKYLKAEDLMGDNVTATIKAVSLEPVGVTNERLPVIYFKEFQKGMVLNKTNSKTIAKLYGDETTGWRGNKIELYEAMVEYQGDVMPALRIRAPQETREPSRSTPVDQPEVNPVTGVAERPPLLTNGETAARQGITAFRSWRDGLSAAEMDTVRPFLERLTATAKYADNSKPKKSKAADNQGSD